jgi:2-polyprenyl-3-methyl-5-hydroxy-6-metoxy-1,4-benzoquinol methylase
VEKPTAIERVLLTKSDFLALEHQIRLQEHLRRYAAVRRFVYGRVLDFACGCGYGTYLLSRNPDVEEVVGVDKDAQSIAWAEQEYRAKNCNFICGDVQNLDGKFDTLVSLETIEHFESDEIYHRICEKHAFDQLILSYPNKKSTHFNPFHLRDLNRQSVCSTFAKYILHHTFSIGDVDFLLFIKKPARMPSHIYSNLIDLR